MSGHEFDSHLIVDVSSQVIDKSPTDEDVRQLVELLRDDPGSQGTWIAQATVDGLLQTRYRERRADNLHREIHELAAVELQRRRRWRFVIVSVLSGGGLAATLVLGYLMALMLPAVQSARDTARKTTSPTSMKQVFLALYSFHDEHNAFPAAYSTDANGRALLSWRVYLLPYLGYDNLFQKFRLGEPWDSPHNISLLAEMPKVYRGPRSDKDGETVYLALPLEDGVICTPNTPTQGSHPPLGVSMQEVTDGTSNTVMLVEVDDTNAVPWTKPVDYPELASQLLGAYRERSGHSSGSSAHPREVRIKCIHALFADGAVIVVDKGVPRSAATKSGGEPKPESF